ncbi:MAG: hypothetical protein KC620_06670 [Myxococcales bacterium]|nr:hypothetical protein [Myxococcales bacterium]
MIAVPLIIADLLENNTWAELGNGHLNLPEAMLNRLLGSISMPGPIRRLRLTCRPGTLVITVQLDLHEKGIPLEPEVDQVFELEQVRLDAAHRFIVLRPIGGLVLREETLSRRRFSPFVLAALNRILHTPTLLGLVREQFPRHISYEQGRLHISLSDVPALRKTFKIGGARVPLLSVLHIRGIRIVPGRAVIRLALDKAAFVDALRAPPPEPEATEERPEPEAPAASAPMPFPEETPVDAARRMGRAGLRLIGRTLGRGR